MKKTGAIVPDTPTKMPKVSVIMNCLNCAKYLPKAIDSIYAQTYKDWEIIFWDNGSTDSSADIAKSYDNRLKYFRQEQTVPLGAARNLALKQAKGEFIAFLDCDDLWMPGKLEKQVHVFEKNHTIDFIYTNYFSLNMETNRRVLGLRGEQPEGDVFEKFLHLYHYPVNMQTVMIRKSAFEQLSPWFDPQLNLAEEFDVFMRILYRSQAAYIDEPLAVYRVHSNMCSTKFMANWPEEIICVLGKLRQMDPDFNSKYSKAIRYYNATIEYILARQSIAENDLTVARKYITPYKWYALKFLFLYIATFMPNRLLSYFYAFRRSPF